MMAIGCQGQRLFTRSDAERYSSPADTVGHPDKGSVARAEHEDDAGDGSRLPRNASVDALVEAAHELVRESDGRDTAMLRKAQTLLEQALRQRPDDAAIHHQQGIVADFLVDYELAERHYRNALELTPRDANLLCDMGYSCFLQERYDESETWLLRALEFNSDHKVAAVNLGAVYAARGRYDDALAWFRRGGSEEEAQANLAEFISSELPEQVAAGTSDDNPFEALDTKTADSDLEELPEELREDPQALLAEAKADVQENPFEQASESPKPGNPFASDDERAEPLIAERADSSQPEPYPYAPRPALTNSRNEWDEQDPFGLGAQPTVDADMLVPDLTHLPALPADSTDAQAAFTPDGSAPQELALPNSLPLWNSGPEPASGVPARQVSTNSSSSNPLHKRSSGKFGSSEQLSVSLYEARIAGLNAGPGSLFPISPTSGIDAVGESGATNSRPPWPMAQPLPPADRRSSSLALPATAARYPNQAELPAINSQEDTALRQFTQRSQQPRTAISPSGQPPQTADHRYSESENGKSQGSPAPPPTTAEPEVAWPSLP